MDGSGPSDLNTKSPSYDIERNKDENDINHREDFELSENVNETKINLMNDMVDVASRDNTCALPPAEDVKVKNSDDDISKSFVYIEKLKYFEESPSIDKNNLHQHEDDSTNVKEKDIECSSESIRNKVRSTEIDENLICNVAKSYDSQIKRTELNPNFSEILSIEKSLSEIEKTNEAHISINMQLENTINQLSKSLNAKKEIVNEFNINEKCLGLKSVGESTDNLVITRNNKEIDSLPKSTDKLTSCDSYDSTENLLPEIESKTEEFAMGCRNFPNQEPNENLDAGCSRINERVGTLEVANGLEENETIEYIDSQLSLNTSICFSDSDVSMESVCREICSSLEEEFISQETKLLTKDSDMSCLTQPDNALKRNLVETESFDFKQTCSENLRNVVINDSSSCANRYQLQSRLVNLKRNETVVKLVECENCPLKKIECTKNRFIELNENVLPGASKDSFSNKSNSNSSDDELISKSDVEMIVRLSPGLEFMLYVTTDDEVSCWIECLLCDLLDGKIKYEGNSSFFKHVYTKEHILRYLKLKYFEEYYASFAEFSKMSVKQLINFIKVRCFLFH